MDYSHGIIIAVPFFALPAIWIVIWTGSHTVSSFLTVLEDTANGNDQISGWSDLGWKDHVDNSLGPLFLAALAAAASYGIATGVEAGVGAAAFWPAFGIALCVLYPVVLLSSLHAGSVWVPLMWPVLKSVVTNAVHWALFFTLMILVAAAYSLPLYYGLRGGRWFTTLIFTGPLLAWCVLVGGRLMGRLAWRTLVREEGAPDDRPDDAPQKRQRKSSRRDKAVSTP